MKKMELSTQKHGYKLIFCIGVFVSGKLKRSLWKIEKGDRFVKTITKRVESDSRTISKRIGIKYFLLCEVRKWIYES